MYTDLTKEAMAAALEGNIKRVRASTRANGRPMRTASTVCTPKMGRLRGRGRVGPVYDSEEYRPVSFDDIRAVCSWVNEHVYVRVGSELRHYLRGAPMGEPGSCAQANGVALHAEQSYLAQREKEHGDGARVATLGFVDDMQFRFAYDRRGHVWSQASAVRMAAEADAVYPAPLSLE